MDYKIETIKLKKFSGRLINYIEVISLPLALAILFVVQNQMFNVWLNIYSKTYAVRLSLATFALGVVFYGPAFIFKKRYKYIYLFLISFLISLLFVAQFLYYRYSQSFLQFSSIMYVDQAPSVAGTIKTLITPELFLFFASFLVVFIAFVLDFYHSKFSKANEFVPPLWEKAFIVFVMIIIIFFGYRYLFYVEKKEVGYTSSLYTDVFDLKYLVKRVGVVNFFIEDFTKYVMRANLITADDKNFLQKYAQEKKPVLPDISGNKYFGAAKGKNVIIIQIESLENVVINKTIYNEEITPNLNKLAKEGMYFDNYYSNIGPGNTADCEFSTMNSLYPLPNDVAFINYAKNKYNALPQLLAENGYHTYSMHGDVPTFWNRSNIYPSLGYQKIFSLEDYVVYRSIGEGPISLGPRLADEDLFNQSIPKLKNLKEPFMATLITLNSHTPFNLPDDLQTLHMPAKTIYDQPQWKYVQSIHYADKAVGEFIDALKKNGLYDNSLILIWGDHGSFSNISDAFSKKYASPALWNSQVPMILLAPGTDLRGTNSEPGSHIDIYPTITNLLGIETPKTVFGQDLLNTKTPVETHFKPITGGIDAILTNNLAYQAGEDGIFENGSCESLPGKKSLPIADCQSLYNEQSNKIKASNIIIRGNLLDFYSSNLK